MVTIKVGDRIKTENGAFELVQVDSILLCGRFSSSGVFRNIDISGRPEEIVNNMDDVLIGINNGKFKKLI